MVRNQELYKLYRDFIKASLELLDEFIQKGEKIPVRREENLYVERRTANSKAFGTKYVHVPIFWRWVYAHEKELKELQEFIDCTNFLMKFKLIKNKDKESIGGMYLLPFLTYFLDTTKTLSFNQKMFDQTYKEIEDYFYSDKLNFIATAPLQKFECEISELNLGNGLKIRKITDQEFSELCRSAKEMGGLLPFHEAMNIEYIIEMPYSIQKEEPISSQEPKEIFDKLVSALRLFKSGIFGFNILQSKPPSWQPMMGTMTSFGTFYKTFSGDKYELTKSEGKDFIMFWDEYKTCDFTNNKFIEVAIKRFNYSHEREKPEDKLIDYMVSLEALFLKEGERAELSYRLSIRTAILLGKNKENREEIFSNVRDAYEFRSKIIHGSIKALNEDLREIVIKIENYLRESIKLFLDLVKTKSYKEIVNTIDKDIFR